MRARAAIARPAVSVSSFFGAMLALVLLLAPLTSHAQSGRNKQQPGSKPATGTGTTRPKRVGTTGGAPQPTPTPALRLPAGTVVL
ncbi:MAG TPA: hypothetical protein VJ715_18755, partial [Pyrinomonadaceae bacterium]|nr:hypothetical protein [Pyrinomonadaceae bacterium]